MPTPTYTPLASVSLTSNVNIVTLSNIPSTYRHLVLTANVPPSDTVNFANAFLRFNGDSGPVYAVSYVGSTGSTLQETSDSDGTGQDALNVFGTLWVRTPTFYKFDIFNYSATNKHKLSLFEIGAIELELQGVTWDTGSDVRLHAGTWNSLSAINSISIHARTANLWPEGTEITLFGIAV